MLLSSQLLFFFSAIGAFNGILLSMYLLFTKPVSTDKRFLALLLLAISLRISKSVWFYFDPNISKIFLQLGLSACFFIGPLLYFYLLCSRNKLAEHPRSWKVHLSLLLGLTCYFSIFHPYSSDPELWGNTLYTLINYSWLIYLVFCLPSVLPILQQLNSKKSLSANDTLILSVFCGVFLIWLAYFTASYTSYIVGALSFSFVLYITVLVWIFTKKQQQGIKYKDKKIEGDSALLLTQKLAQLMNEEALFKNPNLTLPQLAKKVHTSVPYLSQFLNENLGKTFAQYINGLRIEQAKHLLITDSRLTIEVIAERVGYNSQSTFYSSFKQIENCTPAKFRKSQHQKTAQL